MGLDKRTHCWYYIVVTLSDSGNFRNHTAELFHRLHMLQNSKRKHHIKIISWEIEM